MKARSFIEQMRLKEIAEEKRAGEDQALQDFRDFCIPTVCPDSTRNTETKLSNSKLGFKDRKENRVWHPYHGMELLNGSHRLICHQTTFTHEKKKGFAFKLTPTDAHCKALYMSQYSIKQALKNNRLTVRRTQ